MIKFIAEIYKESLISESNNFLKYNASVDTVINKIYPSPIKSSENCDEDGVFSKELYFDLRSEGLHIDYPITIQFDENSYPTVIGVQTLDASDFPTFPVYPQNGKAVIKGAGYYTIRILIGTMTQGNTPLIIKSIHTGSYVELPYNIISNVDLGREQRGDANNFSWGIISNKIKIEAYCNSTIKEGSNIYLYLYDTISKRRSLKANMKITSVLKNGGLMSIDAVDDLQDWQDIPIQAGDTYDTLNLYDYYLWLKSKTPLEYGEIVISTNLGTYLRKTNLMYVNVEGSSLWNLWDNFCGVCGAYMSKYADEASGVLEISLTWEFD